MQLYQISPDRSAHLVNLSAVANVELGNKMATLPIGLLNISKEFDIRA